jgi:hypothetical protein
MRSDCDLKLPDEVPPSLQERYPHYWQLLARNPDASLSGHPCKALEILNGLAEKGQLKGLIEEIQKRAERVVARDPVGGNCHDVTIALLNDLDIAGNSSGWQECNADVDFAGSGNYINHSWVEFGAFALDNADGKCVVLPAAEYEAVARVKNLQKCT